MKRIIINVLIIILLGVMAFSGYRLYSIHSKYQKARSEYDRASNQYVKEKDTESTEESEADATTPPIDVDFAELAGENPDVAGWLYCKDTVIDYPVMHGEDNDLYLHHMLNKEYSFAGCLFEDFRNTRGQIDPATIIYGHSMNDGSMFGTLHEYTSQEYYDKHPTMWYLTPTQNFRLDLVYGFVAKDDDPVYDLFLTPLQMQGYLRSIADKSTFDSLKKYDLTTVDRVIVLSTCAYEFQDARYIVIAVPIPVY